MALTRAAFVKEREKKMIFSCYLWDNVKMYVCEKTLTVPKTKGGEKIQFQKYIFKCLHLICSIYWCRFEIFFLSDTIPKSAIKQILLGKQKGNVRESAANKIKIITSPILTLHTLYFYRPFRFRKHISDTNMFISDALCFMQIESMPPATIRFEFKLFQFDAYLSLYICARIFTYLSFFCDLIWILMRKIAYNAPFHNISC